MTVSTNESRVSGQLPTNERAEGLPDPGERVDLVQLPQQDETELAGEDLEVRTGVEQSPVSLALHWEVDLRLVSSVGTHGGQQGDLTVITVRLSGHHHGFKIFEKLEKFPQKYKIFFPPNP